MHAEKSSPPRIFYALLSLSFYCPISTGSSTLGRAILWDVASGREIKCFTYGGGLLLITVFGPDVATIIGSGNTDIYRWDIVTGEIIARYSGSLGAPLSLAVSPDYQYLIGGLSNGDMVL